MSRFADVRRANRHTTTTPPWGTGTVNTKLTLYGEGIHEGTLRLYAGEAIEWMDAADRYLLFVDLDGTRYSTVSGPASFTKDQP